MITCLEVFAALANFSCDPYFTNNKSKNVISFIFTKDNNNFQLSK